MSKVVRWQIADYLGVGSSPAYHLMGVGFTQVDEEPSAQVESTAYVHNKSKRGTIKGYENTFPFETHIETDEAAIEALYQVGRNQKTGSEAEFDYVRVELFKPIGSDSQTTYAARKFRVAAEISGITGEGTELVTVSGVLHQVGDFVDGTFDTSTKTFTGA
ncbi:MAG: hypothetical protein Q4C00_01515 [Bacillota bacterium]|nr:hypothetical protein [Bacillota bacterium]